MRLESGTGCVAVSALRPDTVDAVVLEGSTREEFVISPEDDGSQVVADYSIAVAVPDLVSNMVASQVIPQLVKAGHVPFAYLPDRRPGSSLAAAGALLGRQGVSGLRPHPTAGVRLSSRWWQEERQQRLCPHHRRKLTVKKDVASTSKT